MFVTFRNKFGLVFTGVYDRGCKPTQFDPGEPECLTVVGIEDEHGTSVMDEFSNEQLRAMEVRYLQEARDACRIVEDEFAIEKHLTKEEELFRYAWELDV